MHRAMMLYRAPAPDVPVSTEERQSIWKKEIGTAGEEWVGLGP